MTEPHPSRRDAALAIHELASLLQRSRALIETGESVDFAGLERETAELMAAIVALPAIDARALLPELDAVLVALDGLEKTLRVNHGSALGEPAAKRIRAVAAYSKPAGGE